MEKQRKKRIDISEVGENREAGSVNLDNWKTSLKRTIKVAA